MDFCGKYKALTFSYDDGVTQDVRLIRIFNEYGLKGTFNLNSGLLGRKDWLNNGTIRQYKVEKSEVGEIYRGHEVAVHTVTHPNLTLLPPEEALKQVEDDRKELEGLVGYPIVGMAYPCGGENNNDAVADMIAGNTPIRYARTIVSNYGFAPQTRLMRFQPTVYHMEFDRMVSLAEQFLASPADEEHPMIFYIWGHAYEFDPSGKWDDFERLCEKLAGHDDIFYGTNKQVLLGLC